MNKYEFRNNLVRVVHEKYENLKDVKFVIIPDIELDKKHNSKDDYMRLTIFNDNNLRGRVFDIETIVTLFSGLAPLFPMWIEVFFREEGIVELKTSVLAYWYLW